MNEETKLGFGWIEVLGMWCFALTSLGLAVVAHAQGDLSTIEYVCLAVFALIGGIALIWTMILTEPYWPKSDNRSFQIGTTSWNRDHYEKFWR